MFESRAWHTCAMADQAEFLIACELGGAGLPRGIVRDLERLWAVAVAKPEVVPYLFVDDVAGAMLVLAGTILHAGGWPTA